MTKIKKTFSLGEDAAQLLEELAEQFYADNQTETVRAGRRPGSSTATCPDTHPKAADATAASAASRPGHCSIDRSFVAEPRLARRRSHSCRIGKSGSVQRASQNERT
jgi:hypothetical protein